MNYNRAALKSVESRQYTSRRAAQKFIKELIHQGYAAGDFHIDELRNGAFRVYPSKGALAKASRPTYQAMVRQGRKMTKGLAETEKSLEAEFQDLEMVLAATKKMKVKPRDYVRNMDLAGREFSRNVVKLADLMEEPQKFEKALEAYVSYARNKSKAEALERAANRKIRFKLTPRQTGFDFADWVDRQEQLGLFDDLAQESGEKESPAPELKAEPHSEKKKEVPAPARNIVHEDVGEKIGGARKDIWAGRGLQLSDLEGMTDRERYEHTTKDSVWPKPDYKALADEGRDRLVLRFMKKVRDALPMRPLSNSDEARTSFIDVIQGLRDYFKENPTEADIGKKGPGGYGWVIKRLIATQGTLSDGTPSERMWNLKLGVYKAFGTKYRRLENAGWGLYELQRDVERKNWPYAKKQKAAREKDEGEIPKRPHLDKLERRGLADYRNGRDIKGEDLLESFKFRGIEYGNWVDQVERQKSLNLAYDSLMDLADTLNIPPDALSLNGRLGLAFGARGRGHFAAHYEPVRLVINLTKISGGGSLAHEWAHALDNYFGEYGKKSETGEPKFLSGGGKDWRSGSVDIRKELSSAFGEIANAIKSASMTVEESVAKAEKQIEGIDAKIKYWRSQIEKNLAAGMNEKDKFIKDSRSWLEVQERKKKDALGYIEALKSGRIKPGTRESDYSQQAHKLSPASRSGETGYYARPTEMLARAFE
ncbi:MAG: hypothetical protein OEZ55_14340, partial [Nitrospinota bacterium]|nr:hypothetical protein [Nitrospinota bacterium]